MKTLFKVIGAILSLCAIYIFLIGAKQVFKTEKVYIKYGEYIFHSVPICPRLGVEGFDKEYIEETGEIVGSEEVSKRESWNDISLDMCDYCYSLFDIYNRNNYFQEVYTKKGMSFKDAKKKAKKLRAEKKLKEFEKKYPKLFE